MPVHSGQTGPHRRLADTVRRHLTQPYRKPFAAHTLTAFQTVAARVASHRGPLWLDSGCGVGESSATLARRRPETLVLGVDKSAARLAKADLGGLANCVLVRADLVDFLRLAAAAGWRPQRHYLLYPNPWPKTRHLRRRWHGSALFPTLLRLGGRLELRSNWEIYLREFAAALSIAGVDAETERFVPQTPLTPFERKYHDTGQRLWRLRADLTRAGSGGTLSKTD